MSSIKDKLSLMRESERLSKKEFSELTGVPYTTYIHYETGKYAPSSEVLMKIFCVPLLQKYTLWFMTDQIAPESGQIAPVLAHYGQDETDYSASGKKTG